MLLGGGPAILSPNPVRILHSRDAKGSEQYIEAVNKYMQDHRLEHRMTQLGTNRGEDPSIGEAVDRDILRSMEHGMNKIRKLFTSPYSSQNHPSEIATKILQSLLLDAVQSLRPQNPTQINPSSVVNNITGTKGSGRGTITSTSSSEKRQRSE